MSNVFHDFVDADQRTLVSVGWSLKGVAPTQTWVIANGELQRQYVMPAPN